MSETDLSSCRFETQGPDEKIELLLRAHEITNLGWIVSVVVLAFFGLGFFLFSLTLDSPFSTLQSALLLVVWLLLLIGFALQRYLYWFFNVYLVTNKKIVDVDFLNLFYKQISETPLENIQDSTYRAAGFFQNHFDYGDLMIQTAGETENFEFLNIPDPDGVQEKIMDLSAQAKKVLGRNPL
ncbi:MAG: PH domain-containing protein [bacterium]|nr:PH domain-containing protein [bacterium]